MAIGGDDINADVDGRLATLVLGNSKGDDEIAAWDVVTLKEPT